jgi:hypothetical protein
MPKVTKTMRTLKLQRQVGHYSCKEKLDSPVTITSCALKLQARLGQSSYKGVDTTIAKTHFT